MEEKKNRLGALLKSLGSGERRVKLIVIVGFLGIFLLFLSQFTGKKEESQLLATHKTVGKYKVDVAEERIAEINQIGRAHV